MPRDLLSVDLDRYRVSPGGPANLADRPTDDPQGLSKKDDGDAVRATLAAHLDRLNGLQERLYAERKQSLLVVLQAMDAAGKDSTVRRVFGGWNPQGVRVWNFKAPSKKELDHDFLWRVHKRVPGAGYVGVFNRSHYEDVLIVKVHNWADKQTIDRRYDHINEFEALLADRGTKVLKIMLHVSKDYQLERLRRRLRRADKHWKFNPEDLAERARWPDYQKAFEAALSKCSTEAAPWYVVPAERRWFRDLALRQLLVETLEGMNPRFPEPAWEPGEYTAEGIE